MHSRRAIPEDISAKLTDPQTSATDNTDIHPLWTASEPASHAY
jgi:hypothetical protein